MYCYNRIPLYLPTLNPSLMIPTTSATSTTCWIQGFVISSSSGGHSLIVTNWRGGGHSLIFNPIRIATPSNFFDNLKTATLER